MPPSPELSSGDPQNRGATAIFLIGYRGSGKTSVGRALARAAGFAFHDTDEMVELSGRKSIARIFAEDGEPAFRALESAALGDLARRSRDGERFVAATGGGIVISPANVALLRSAGLVVWLSAPAGVLRERIGSDPASAARRPALRGASSRDEVEALLAEREPLYRAAAHAEVSVAEVSAEEAARRILRASAGWSRPASVDARNPVAGD